MAYTHGIYRLQAQILFPDRHRHPQHPLVVFKAVAGDPGCAAGKLDLIQYDKSVRKEGF